MTAASVKAQSCSQCGRHTRINSKIHLDGAIATLTGLAPACSSGGCPGPTEGPGFRVQPNEVVYGEKQTITLSISPLNLCNGGGASVELSSCGGDLFYIKKPGDAYWTISSTVLNAYRRDQSQCPGGPGGPGGGTESRVSAAMLAVSTQEMSCASATRGRPSLTNTSADTRNIQQQQAASPRAIIRTLMGMWITWRLRRPSMQWATIPTALAPSLQLTVFTLLHLLTAQELGYT